MTQHCHSPPRDHQNQHTEKCSVHTRRCLALQCTLISCSSSSFCSTGLSVTSPRSRSESIFIPLQASGTTCVVSSILVCFFLGLLQLFTILLLPTPSSQPSAFRTQPYCSCIPGGDSYLSTLDLSLSVQSTMSDCLSGILSWISHGCTPHIQFHYSIFNTLSVILSPNLLVLVLL